MKTRTPGGFLDALAGHTHPKHLLRRVLEHERVPTGFLFFGARGRGKRLAAEAWLRVLFCEKQGLAPCGRCKSCVLADSGGHPDVKIVEPDADRGIITIEAVRGLIDWFTLAPYQSSRRAALLDDAHLAGEEAQNALLKLLEEPPGDSVLIVVTPDPGALVETIRSRLFRLYFGPLGPEGFEIARRKLPKTSLAWLERLWRLSEGSPGEAIELAGAFPEDETSARLARLFSTGGKPFFSAEEIAGEKKRGKKEAGDDRRALASFLAFATADVLDVIEMKLGARVAEGTTFEVLGGLDTARLDEIARLLLEAKERIEGYVAARLVLDSLEIRLQRILAAARRGAPAREPARDQ
jgi:DNA polymerase III subunit delta'